MQSDSGHIHTSGSIENDSKAIEAEPFYYRSTDSSWESSSFVRFVFFPAAPQFNAYIWDAVAEEEKVRRRELAARPRVTFFSTSND